MQINNLAKALAKLAQEHAQMEELLCGIAEKHGWKWEKCEDIPALVDKVVNERDEAVALAAALRELAPAVANQSWDGILESHDWALAEPEAMEKLRYGISYTSTTAEAYEQRIRADERRRMLDDVRSVAGATGKTAPNPLMTPEILEAIASYKGREPNPAAPTPTTTQERYIFGGDRQETDGDGPIDTPDPNAARKEILTMGLDEE